MLSREDVPALSAEPMSRTEAGRRLLAEWKRDPKELWTVEQVAAAIVAIEDEATALPWKWTTERRPGDDATCERLGCEDRTHPVHHRVATTLPPNCIAVDREYYEVLRDCYMNRPAAPPIPATEPWQETVRRAMSCSCPVVVRLNHEPHRPPCPLAGETL